jgi:hypothetical protein
MPLTRSARPCGGPVPLDPGRTELSGLLARYSEHFGRPCERRGIPLYLNGDMVNGLPRYRDAYRHVPGGPPALRRMARLAQHHLTLRFGVAPAVRSGRPS